MTPLERQGERLGVRIRQYKSVRQWIERKSRVVRPVSRSDRRWEWGEGGLRQEGEDELLGLRGGVAVSLILVG